MKTHWLLPGTFVTTTLLMLSSPAQAAKLQSWRFDAKQNRLEINTEGPVQPQAQLVFNPTRLVIDLPGTNFGRPQLTQSIGGAIRSVRVGQFDPQTARIVVELSPGYTLDPKQVKFEGKTASRWTVQLPTPQAEGVASSPPSPSPKAPSPKSEEVIISPQKNVYNVVTIDSETEKKPEFSKGVVVAEGTIQVESLQVTGDGFFVRSNGGNPRTHIIRSRDRKTIFMDISGATLSPNFGDRDISVNRHGVNRVEMTQLQKTPPAVRMTLRVDKDTPDWRISTSSSGVSSGLVVLPNRYAGNLPKNNYSDTSSDNSSKPVVEVPTRNSISTIESVELPATGTQLLIRADQRLSPTSTGWDRASGLYRITIPNAKLASAVKGPNFDASSPVLRVRLQQQDSRTVVIYVQPAAGVRIGQANQLSGQLLSLELQRTRSMTPPIALPTLPRPNPQPLPSRTITSNPPARNPRAPKGRVVIVVDPGHGGKDSGALGIGGIQEKNIILPIGKRVAEILQQNGVQAVLTRDSDYFVTLQGRVDIADRVNADVFVSVHANSAGADRPEVSGLETYYYDSGLSLARIVHNNILRSVNVRDRGVRKARFYVLRKSSMPSILVEAGYLTGREDAAKLSNRLYQNQMADAIARGVLQYLKQK
ncbi:N-acetylmuramoyl-L-alanine amidase [Mastigocladopsis repens]|uniref:N-acetylmuramoyl-L-alanine amidase n=1 Tax=Mastigocladopsis repens TaxID=221287 RepID=UPI0002DE916F|nr:N-acetylmuramoyl-L-alanine amidase [Mastigocladopsis repens]